MSLRVSPFCTVYGSPGINVRPALVTAHSDPPRPLAMALDRERAESLVDPERIGRRRLECARPCRPGRRRTTAHTVSIGSGDDDARCNSFGHEIEVETWVGIATIEMKHKPVRSGRPHGSVVRHCDGVVLAGVTRSRRRRFCHLRPSNLARAARASRPQGAITTDGHRPEVGHAQTLRMHRDIALRVRCGQPGSRRRSSRRRRHRHPGPPR